MTRGRRRASLLALALLWTVVSPAWSAAFRGEHRDVALRTVEGEITALEQVAGEGGLALLVAVLQPEEGSPLRIALAPEQVLEEIDFSVEVGDRLRVRIVDDGSDPAHAQRVLNLSRDRMVRLRTLRDVPLWSGSGGWHGGAARGRPGAAPAARPGGGQGPGGPGRR